MQTPMFEPVIGRTVEGVSMGLTFYGVMLGKLLIVPLHWQASEREQGLCGLSECGLSIHPDSAKSESSGQLRSVKSDGSFVCHTRASSSALASSHALNADQSASGTRRPGPTTISSIFWTNHVPDLSQRLPTSFTRIETANKEVVLTGNRHT